MTFADDQVGKVLDALDASPYADNTIIVLTGDNGYHVGEKDCIQKWHLWDESTRVPLFIHVPHGQGNGQTCARPVSLIDVYPTLIDLTGLPSEPNQGRSGKRLEGHSLVPLLKGPEQGEWNGPSVALMGIRDGKFSAAADDDTYAPHFSVRSKRYRYTLCGNGEEELYDHENDPNEWTNLAGNSKYASTKQRLRAELTAILRATGWPRGYAPENAMETGKQRWSEPFSALRNGKGS